MDKVANYILTPAAMCMVAGSSKGAQRKYYEAGKWYKENYSEYMVSVGENGYTDRGYLDFFFEPREKIYFH